MLPAGSISGTQVGVNSGHGTLDELGRSAAVDQVKREDLMFAKV
jgi:hypothetical protein